MKESYRLAMKSVAGGKVVFAVLATKKIVWMNRDGDRLPPHGLNGIRNEGWVRMEELADPPIGTKAWFRVLLSVEGRRVWMGEEPPQLAEQAQKRA